MEKSLLKTQIFSLLVSCFFYTISSAQPVIKTQRVFGGTQYDALSRMSLTKDGGFILAGYSNSNKSFEKTENSRGRWDYWVIKLDSSYNIQWDKTIGGNDNDYLPAIQQTSDGGYILGGSSSSNASGEKTENSRGVDDYWIVKLDQSGNIQWDQTIGGNSHERLTSIQQTSDGGYILGGHSSSDASGEKTENSRGDSDYWIVKLDKSGNIQWDKTIGGNDYDIFLTSIQQTSEGGYILGGISASDSSGEKTENSRGSFDYWIIKLDKSGNIQWDKTIGGDSNDDLTSIQQTSDGGYILGGDSWSDASGEKTESGRGLIDYWIIKLDELGNIQWDKTIGGKSWDNLNSVQQTTDRGYILGGFSESNVSGEKTENSRGHYDYWMVKLSSKGNVQWDKTIGGSKHDGLSSIREIRRNVYVLGGTSFSKATGDKKRLSRGGADYWLVELKYYPVFCKIQGQKRDLCGGGNYNYFIDVKRENKDAKYTWSVPDGCKIISGQGTDSIEINIPSNFVNGVISVEGPGLCVAENIIRDTLTTKPTRPAEINGPASVTAGQKGLTFSTTEERGTNYYWIVPADAKIVSGQGTSSVKLNWGSTTEPIVVKAFKCGDSSQQRMEVHVIEGAVATAASAVSAAKGQMLTDKTKVFIFPNPAHQTATIVFPATKADQYTLQLTDRVGKTLSTQKVMSKPGLNTATINVSRYASDMYFINLFNSKEKYTLKLNKQ